MKFESLSGFGAGGTASSGIAPSAGKVISMTNLGSIMPQPLGGPSFKQSDHVTSTVAGNKSKSFAANNIMDTDSKEDEDEDDDEEEDEDDMKPMGIEEFRARVMGMK